MKKTASFAALAALTVALCACGGLSGRDAASSEFDRETSADDARMRESQTRTSLSSLESAVADYLKAERKIPENLDVLVPRYIAAIPMLDIPVCGRETNKVKIYPSDVLRDGQVDGSRIRGTGLWGYVRNESRVVIFADCRKPSRGGVPWYQVRGLY